MSEPDVSAYPEEVAYGAENLRVPPHSIQGEQSLLGSLMLDNETWDKIADKVAAGDFYMCVVYNIKRGLSVKQASCV